MKKNILITVSVITNAFTGVCLLRASWLRFLWRLEATTNSEFAAGLSGFGLLWRREAGEAASEDREEPQGYTSRPTEMDGDFVVSERNWLTAIRFQFSGPGITKYSNRTNHGVTTFNERIQAFHEHPEKWQERRAKEIDYWQREVLGRRAANANAH